MNAETGQPDHSAKFSKNWHGPYIIREHRFDDASSVYLIEDPATRKQKSVNANLLARYFPRLYYKQNSSVASVVPPCSAASSATTAPVVPEFAPHGSMEGRPLLTADGPAVMGIPDSLHAAAASFSDASHVTPAFPECRSEQSLQPPPDDVVPLSKAMSPTAAHTSTAQNRQTRQPRSSAPRIRTSAKECLRQRQRQALPTLTDADYQQILISHEVDRIVSHARDRHGYYYIVQWVDPTLTHTRVRRNGFDTLEVLHDYWQSLPVKVRPREFKHLPYVGQRVQTTDTPHTHSRRGRRLPRRGANVMG